jgi:hypothetical protein
MLASAARGSRGAILSATRGLAIRGLDKVKHLDKPKSKTIQRRRSFDPNDNPFLASALSLGNGGGFSPAENQIKSFMAQGGFDHLEGEGKPLPDGNPPPFMSREEKVIDDLARHMCRERDGLGAEDKALFKKAALREEMKAKQIDKEHLTPPSS